MTKEEAQRKAKIPKKVKDPSRDGAITVHDTLHSNCAFEIGDAPGGGMRPGVPLLLDIPMVAACLKVSLEKYFFTLVQPAAQWKIFQIPKKRKFKTLKMPDGSKKTFAVRNVRTIQAPGVLMKYILWKYKKELFDKIQLPSYITGFREGQSCVQTAKAHLHGNTIISFDIMNAYPSTSRAMIREKVLKPLGYSHMIAHHIASHVTTDNMLDIPLSRKELLKLSDAKIEACNGARKQAIRSLPQGSPASPVIFNCVVAATFGPELEKYCAERGLTLTVYADDVTVSTAKGAPALEHEAAMLIVKEITGIIRAHKFMVNYEKTKIMTKGKDKQTVMGITVNDGMHTNERYLNLRAILHNVMQNGMTLEAMRWCDKQVEMAQKSGDAENTLRNLNLKPYVSYNHNGKPIGSGKPDDVPVDQFISWLRGNLNWLSQVDERHGVQLKAQFELAYAKYQDDKIQGLRANMMGPSYYAVVGGNGQESPEPTPMDDALEQLWGAKAVQV